MPTLSHLADAVTAEAHAFADLIATLDPRHLRAPTPCAGWSVRDLTAHVASGLLRDAEAFHRARFGTNCPPGELTLSDDADHAAVIRLGIEHLHAALAHPPHPWPAIPTPFGAYAVDDALRCLVIEFGVHRDDLRLALGDRDSAYSPATLDALFTFGELYLLLQAEPLEAQALTFTLAAPSATMSVTWTGDHWSRGSGAPRECRITASDDTIARLMLRRLDVTDSRVDLRDPAGIAPLFASSIRPL
jgi:uncharacterized protein (TIGR03083 family)